MGTKLIKINVLVKHRVCKTLLLFLIALLNHRMALAVILLPYNIYLNYQ